MKIFNGYILVSEITAKANKTASWLYTTKSVEIEHIGGVPVVKIDSLPKKYQDLGKECQDLRNYYPYAEFGREIGRASAFMNVIDFQRRKAHKANKKNKPLIIGKKVRGYKLIELSEEFIELANKTLTPYKLGQKYDKDDFKVIIEMQGMKIGFY